MKNTIYNEDCLLGMKSIASNSIDMILCDLPYGTTQCSWDVVIPLDVLWSEYNRVIKKDGAIVLTACNPFTSVLVSSNIKNFKYSMVWEKSKGTGFLNAKKRPLVAHEDVLVFCNGKVPYFPQMTIGEAYDKGVRKEQSDNDVYGSFKKAHVKSDGLRYPRSVVYFKTAESEGKTIHKTQKPVALFEYLIKTYTNEGDIVLDTCMGSGTTAIAAMKSRRNFLGFETDKEFFDKSLQRISHAKLS